MTNNPHPDNPEDIRGQNRAATFEPSAAYKLAVDTAVEQIFSSATFSDGISESVSMIVPAGDHGENFGESISTHLVRQEQEKRKRFKKPQPVLVNTKLRLIHHIPTEDGLMQQKTYDWDWASSKLQVVTHYELLFDKADLNEVIDRKRSEQKEIDAEVHTPDDKDYMDFLSLLKTISAKKQ